MTTRSTVAAVCALCAATSASFADVPPYVLTTSFDAPGGAFGFLPDGRAITAVGNDIRVQDGPFGGSYTTVATVPDGFISDFGASFLRVSPDGARLAIGDNNFGPGAEVLLFNTADVIGGDASSPTTFATGNFDAHWANNNELFVAGGDFGDTFVNLLDANAGTVTRVVTGVGGASGGVTIRNNTLFTANGFDFDEDNGSETGEVRAFDLNDFDGITPLDFEAEGTNVADALSGGSLGFDAFGSLLIGGAEFGGGESGFAAVVDPDAIAQALLGGGAAQDSDELRLSPDADAIAYSIRYNHEQNLLWVVGGGTAYLYVVPAPGAGALLALGLGVIGSRRRR